MATEERNLTTIRPDYDGILRRPKFDIRFLTEESEFHIVHDTGISLTNRYMTESVVSITTSNAMDDDSSAFSFVLAGFMEWDKLVNSNDMIILKIHPSEVDPEDHNVNDVEEDVVMLGLVSEVRVEAEYSDDSRLYRITGQSFAKAFIQFELNTVRQVTVPSTIGWLSGVGEGGNLVSEIKGKTVAETVEALYERFIQYMDYDFRYITGSGGDTERKAHNTLLRNRIETNFTSWKSDEYLMDPTPFLNFEGSFNQMLNEVVTRPFCEMFFDVHSSEEGNEKAEFIVRRTPFDKEDWEKLPRHWVRSRQVVSEDLAQSDLDAFAVFNVFPENNYLKSTSGMVRPKYSPMLVNKYGYKMFEVIHRFLSTINSGDNKTLRNNGRQSGPEVIIDIYNNMYANISKTVTTNREIARRIVNGLESDANLTEVEELVKATPDNGVNHGTPLADIAMDIFKDVDYDYDTKTTAIGEEYDMSQNLIDQYSTRLYNWYANNPNYYSGDIVVVGHPDFRLGNRLVYHDTETNVFMEFYIESVEHEFSYQEGYTTTLGVTRGLRIKNGMDDGGRFNPPSGPAQEFKGGYLGEMSIGQMEEAAEREAAGAGTIEGSIGNIASGVVWPARGTITSSYGMRHHPTYGDYRMHNGTDIGADAGVLIGAMADGVVVTSSSQKYSGNFLVVDHGILNGIGHVQTKYSHLREPTVSVEQNVRAGQNIGIMGATGEGVTGVHLHLEILVDGSFVDPEPFLNTHAGPKP